MEQSKNASWQICEIVSRANLIFLLDSILWLSVIYFSVYEDGKAALLSYVSVALTVYAFRGIENINDALANFFHFISKILLVAGIALVMYSKFSNTAFYSICLGFLIQKMMYDAELRAKNVNLDLSVQVSHEVAEVDASDEFKQLLARESLKLQKQTQDTLIQEDKIKELNTIKELTTIKGIIKELNAIKYEPNSLDAVTNMQLQSTLRKESETIPKEIQSSPKNLNKPYQDNSEIHSSHQEVFSIEDFQRYFHEQSEKSRSMYLDKNFNDESILKCSDTLLQWETSSSCVDNMEEFKNLASLCTLKVQILNLQEYALREFSKIKAKFDFDVDNIERELRENELSNIDMYEKSANLKAELLSAAFTEDVKKFDAISSGERELKENLETNMDYSPKPAASNDATLKIDFAPHDTKQLDALSNIVEFLEEPETKIEKVVFNEVMNVRSEAYSDRPQNLIKNKDLISCCRNNFCQQNRDEIKQKQLKTTGKCVESSTEPENKVKKELFYEQVNNGSDASKTNPNAVENELNFCNYLKCQQNEIKFDANFESVDSSKDNIYSPFFNKISEKLDIDFQKQETVGKADSTETDEEKDMMHATSSEGENCLKTNEELNFITKYQSVNCTCLKTVDIQHEKETCAYCLNLKTLKGDSKALPESKNCLELVSSTNPCKPLDLRGNLSKGNELANDAGDRNVTKECEKTSENIVASVIPYVEDVVNRIDLGFIYALGS